MKYTNNKNNISELLKVYIINSITKSYILNFKIRPLVTEYALMIKLVDETNSAHSFNHYHVYFGHSWSYFDIQNLRYLLYILHSHAKSMNEITVTLSFSNTHTIYKEKGQNFQKNSKFPNFQKCYKISKFSRILCNKTITTLELDQYEVLWSFTDGLMQLNFWSFPGPQGKYSSLLYPQILNN